MHELCHSLAISSEKSEKLACMSITYQGNIFIVALADFTNLPLTLTDGPEENSSPLLSTPFVEDAQHRLKWTAHLEFTHNHEVGDLTWDKVGLPATVIHICD